MIYIFGVPFKGLKETGSVPNNHLINLLQKTWWWIKNTIKIVKQFYAGYPLSFNIDIFKGDLNGLWCFGFNLVERNLSTK